MSDNFINIIFRYIVFIVITTWIVVFLISKGGIFTIDEIIYILGINSVLSGTWPFAENGYREFPFEPLRLWLLVNGPDGLSPQYPSGFSILAAIPYYLGGNQGVIFLNLIAAFGTLFLTYRLANDILGEKYIARLSVVLLSCASFLVEYAIGLWPHSLAVFCALLTIYMSIKSATSMGREQVFYAVAAGFVLGIGLTIRADVLFLGPPLALWILWYARKPVHFGIASFVGFLPMALCASWLNWIKFGVFFPVSYGPSSSGGLSLSGHITWVLISVLALVLVCAIRFSEGKLRILLIAGGLLGAVLGGLAFHSEVGAVVWRFLRGYYVLVLDLREHSRVGLDTAIREPINGVVLFWGVLKKSLAQSMPWLGVLPLLFFGKPRPAEVRMIVLIVLSTVLIVFPYARTEWHGGLAHNMRYFLVLLPLLSIAGAMALARLKVFIAEHNKGLSDG